MQTPSMHASSSTAHTPVPLKQQGWPVAPHVTMQMASMPHTPDAHTGPPCGPAQHCWFNSPHSGSGGGMQVPSMHVSPAAAHALPSQQSWPVPPHLAASSTQSPATQAPEPQAVSNCGTGQHCWLSVPHSGVGGEGGGVGGVGTGGGGVGTGGEGVGPGGGVGGVVQVPSMHVSPAAAHALPSQQSWPVPPHLAASSTQSPATQAPESQANSNCGTGQHCWLSVPHSGGGGGAEVGPCAAACCTNMNAHMAVSIRRVARDLIFNTSVGAMAVCMHGNTLRLTLMLS